MIIRKTVLLYMAVCVAMALQACINTDKRVTSAIGLKTTKDVFIATAKTAKRLCEQGVLSDNDCATIESTYTQGRVLLISAKAVWDGMVTMDSFDANSSYNELIISVVNLTANMEAIIRKVGE